MTRFYKDTFPQKIYEEKRGNYISWIIWYEIHLTNILHNPKRYEYLLVRRIDDWSVEKYNYYSREKKKRKQLRDILIFKNWNDKILIKI